ncbi:MAG: sensor histidine kinase [Chloroflexi bacterium]|nr:sensor histidine kinase [Chloroflexota bacterium]
MDLLHRFLRVPTFHKILLANSIIVSASVVFGFQMGVHSVSSNGTYWGIMFSITLVGIAIGFAANFLVLKAALLPISRLQQAARNVRAGDLSARVDKLRLSDTYLDNVIEAFNAMLDSVERNQRQLQTLSRQVLHVQEEERKRVARELHDETAQALTALLVQLRLLSNAATLEEAQCRVAELRALTARSLEEVRHLALELRSAVLDDLGLVAGLEWYVDEYNGRYSIRAQLECADISRRLPPQVELSLYRVVQEALTNAARHSRAALVWVRLKLLDNGWIDLSIEDDGQGFDVEKVLSRRNGGLGLFGMQERIALVGGEFQIVSAPGQHTIVHARVPIAWESLRP